MMASILSNIFLLISAMFSAVYFQKILFGASVQDGIVKLTLPLVISIIISNLIGHAGKDATFAESIAKSNQVSALIALLLSVVAFSLGPVPAPITQIIMYGGIGAIFIFLFVILPNMLRRRNPNYLSFVESVKLAYQQRYLVQTWSTYQIQARYSETFLGVVWIFIGPLLEALALAFAFTQILGRGVGVDGIPVFLFILSGRVAFIPFQKIVSQSPNSIRSHRSVIKQVYFPREIIIILLAIEVLVDFLLAFCGLIIIIFFYHIQPNWYYILLPIPITIIFIFSLGICFITSWIGLLIRDLQQIIGIFVQLFFYVTVLYNGRRVGEGYEFIPLINPMSALVEAVRSIVIYANPPDWISLFFPAILAGGLLYAGYLFFKVNEDRFPDYL